MPSSSKAEPLLEALETFCRRLHFEVPMELAHCCQFSNDTDILRTSEEEKTKVWSELLQKLGDLAKTDQVSIDEQVSIVNQFAPRIQSLIDEVVKKHGNYKKEAEALMKGRIHQFCDYFSSSIQEKLLLEKDMDIHTLDEYLEQGKSMTLNHFRIWRHGNLEYYDDHEKILKNKLEQLANEVLKSQWKHLGGRTEMRTTEDDYDRNKLIDNSNSSDVAPASKSNIPATAIATDVLSNARSDSERALGEMQMGIVENHVRNLEAVSVEQDYDLQSVTCEAVQFEFVSNDDVTSFSSNPYPPHPLQLIGSAKIGVGYETFTTGERQGEMSISRDNSISSFAIVLNAFDKVNSQPKSEMSEEKRSEDIDPDLNTGISPMVEENPTTHNVSDFNADDSDSFGTKGQIACASENAGSSSEVVAQSEGFSDEENVTVISSETWTSESAFLVEDQNAICSVGIEDENEKLVGERSIPTGESELNPNGDSIVVTNSGRKNGNKKRRRSQKENNGPASVETKRRRKFKETTISATASGQAPTLTVRRTKKVVVAVAAANSSTKVRRSKRNSKLASSPNDNTATGKKQGGSVKVDAKIVQVEGGFQCPEPACGKIFPRIRTYRQHHQEIHQLKNVEFRCSYPKCEKVFSRKRVLGSHQLFHIQPELFTCESCHRTFASASTTRKHKKSCRGSQSEPLKAA